MNSLPIFLRVAGRPVMLIGDGAAADAKRRLLDRAGAVVVDERGDAPVAIVAVEDDPAPVVARLRARGILVNAVDRPDLCDFTLPAIVDRDPVLVVIGTGGVSAGLAAALRQRLEALLPAGVGRVAEALHSARAHLRARFPEAGQRRRAIASLLAPGGALDPLVEHPAPEATLADIDAPPARIEQVRLAGVDPDDLTLGAARLLALADRVYHAPDCPPAILDRARADAERIVGAAPALPPPGLSVEVVGPS